MRRDKALLIVLMTYLLIFAAGTLHKNPSGLRRKHFFRRIRPVKKEIYEEKSEEHDLTPLIIEKFSVKAPSEPDSY